MKKIESQRKKHYDFNIMREMRLVRIISGAPQFFDLAACALYTGGMDISLSSIPATPGVYLFKDEAGRIIYVGKAKHLRRRVASYFRRPGDLTPKTRAMMSHAASVDTISTITEKEAFLLEASLIKKHRPHYNIVLRDDKQYVLFCLDRNVPFPRLVITRPKTARSGRPVHSSHEETLSRKESLPSGRRRNMLFFGPFVSSGAARETWRAIHHLFPLRRCSERAFAHRTRPCLYHHLGQCLAPCVCAVDPAEYRRMIDRVELFLAGRSSEVLDQLQTEMEQASESLEFERAAQLRDQIRAIRQTVERQAAVLPGAVDIDVVGIAESGEGLGLGILFVRQGKVLDGKTFFWPGIGLAEAPEVIASFLAQFYGPASIIPPRILIPWDFPVESGQTEEDNPRALLEEMLSDARQGSVSILPPRNAMENQLVSMAGANARESARTAQESITELLAKRLGLARPPVRIECVDVSHTGGQETRVGLVVFEDGKACKDAYRAYAIPTEIAHGDDYAALAAWTARRIESGPPWPDMLLIDGGRAQLATIERALADNGRPDLFPLAAIAKARSADGRADRRAGNIADRIFLPGRSNPLPLREGAPELLFLQMVRDTAHDFVIGRHRKARNAAMLSSELMRLPGVGPKTAKLLWRHFDSLPDMAKADEAALAAIPGIGPAKAKKLRALLKGFAVK